MPTRSAFLVEQLIQLLSTHNAFVERVARADDPSTGHLMLSMRLDLRLRLVEPQNPFTLTLVRALEGGTGRQVALTAGELSDLLAVAVSQSEDECLVATAEEISKHSTSPLTISYIEGKTVVTL